MTLWLGAHTHISVVEPTCNVFHWANVSPHEAKFRGRGMYMQKERERYAVSNM